MRLFHLPFTVQVADIDESMDPAKAPEQEVARVSCLKAQAIACEARRCWESLRMKRMPSGC